MLRCTPDLAAGQVRRNSAREQVGWRARQRSTNFTVSRAHCFVSPGISQSTGAIPSFPPRFLVRTPNSPMMRPRRSASSCVEPGEDLLCPNLGLAPDHPSRPALTTNLHGGLKMGEGRHEKNQHRAYQFGNVKAVDTAITSDTGIRLKPKLIERPHCPYRRRCSSENSRDRQLGRYDRRGLGNANGHKR